MSQQMKPERQMAIEAMKNMGWTAVLDTSKARRAWKFSRPDTGGLWDSITCRQDQLSMEWAVRVAIQYGDAPDLRESIVKLQQDWFRERFRGICQRLEDAE